MINQYQYIIIGQGLAGTTLAHIFLQQDIKVLVVDEQRPVTSSKVAAGVWNPVVFRKYTQSFLASALLKFNAEFYPALENRLGTKFYYPLPYYKVFSSPDDLQHWKNKLTNPEVEAFLSPGLHQLNYETINAPYGAAQVNSCGFADIKTYLAASAAYFIANNALKPRETFDYGQLELTENGVRYREIEAEKIIFCEGMAALTNPWWNYLPFAPAKGEVLTIKARLKNIPEAIINKGVFIVPLGNDTYRVGSTYRWEDLESTPTEDAKAELIEKLENLIKVPYEIINHQAAIRPAVQGRRPLLGLHPQHPQIGIFNGLGSRGVMLAPYFANQLVNHLLSGEELNSEVDVARFPHTL